MPNATAALLRRQATARAALTTEVRRRVAAAWAKFDAPYDPAAVNAFAESIAATVRAGQVNLAALTDAYMAQLIGFVEGRPVNPAGSTVPTQLRGADPNDVYQRPVEQYRYLISKGLSAEEALRQAGLRLDVLAFTDMTLAARWSAHNTMRLKGIEEYRRVPSGGRVCGLCIAAAQRTYHISGLLPIHNRCSCEVVPEGTDGILNVSDEHLGDLYDTAGSTSAEDLTKTRYVVHEHGELGPTLTLHGQRFRGPSDLP